MKSFFSFLLMMTACHPLCCSALECATIAANPPVTANMEGAGFSTKYIQVGFRTNFEQTTVREPVYSRFAFPWWFDMNPYSLTWGLDASPCIWYSGTLNGIGISLGSMRNRTTGLIISPLCSIQGTTSGVSLSLINICFAYSPGVQAGAWNTCLGFNRIAGATVQVSCFNFADQAEFQIGIGNGCSVESDFQLGLINFGRSNPQPPVPKRLKRTALQIGLFNSSENGMFQIGLLNYNRSSVIFKWFPFFNCSAWSSSEI